MDIIEEFLIIKEENESLQKCIEVLRSENESLMYFMRNNLYATIEESIRRLDEYGCEVNISGSKIKYIETHTTIQFPPLRLGKKYGVDVLEKLNSLVNCSE